MKFTVPVSNMLLGNWSVTLLIHSSLSHLRITLIKWKAILKTWCINGINIYSNLNIIHQSVMLTKLRITNRMLKKSKTKSTELNFSQTLLTTQLTTKIKKKKKRIVKLKMAKKRTVKNRKIQKLNFQNLN